jgi:DNA polymerase III subunit epsilon
MQALNLPTIKLNSAKAHPHPKDRERALAWARQLVRRNNWILLDTETTGTSKSDEVIQIGVLSANGEVLLNTLIKPVRNTAIPREAAAVHGITMDMLTDAPTMQQILPQLCSVLKGKTTIIYNAEFDTRLLQQTVGPEAASSLMSCLRAECAMKMYSAYAGDWMDSKGDYKWQKLPGAAHGAIEDCQAMLALIHQMASIRTEQPGWITRILEFLRNSFSLRLD